MTAAAGGTGAYRGRFAPSPTGPLHFGSLIAAMGSYLQARSQSGQWLVRIEDLDPPREIRGASRAILDALDTLGFEWDEEPVYQSTRRRLYQDGIEQLWHQGRTYACRCSRQQIANTAFTGIEGPIYPGHCRRAGWPDGPGHALRFRAGPGQTCFDDGLQGTICQDVAADIGDFVIRRRDGLTAYQMAVVVDDAAQGITEVVRGCDLIDSTPRQIQVGRALGLPVPAFMHLPVAVDAAGQKLSKQTGAKALDQRKPLPALVAAARALSQHPPEVNELESVADFWRWAIPAWSPGLMTGLRSIAAPPAAFA